MRWMPIPSITVLSLPLHTSIHRFSTTQSDVECSSKSPISLHTKDFFYIHAHQGGPKIPTSYSFLSTTSILFFPLPNIYLPNFIMICHYLEVAQPTGCSLIVILVITIVMHEYAIKHAIKPNQAEINETKQQRQFEINC